MVRGKKQTKTHLIDCAFDFYPKEQSCKVNMNRSRRKTMKTKAMALRNVGFKVVTTILRSISNLDID